MAVISGILTPVTTHDIRRGAAQDIAHLPAPKDGSGFTTTKLDSPLAIPPTSSYSKGITQEYVGAPTRNFYNDRADREFQHPFGPEFSETGAYDLIKKRVSEQELQQWQQLNEPTEDDRTSRNARDRAKSGVRQQRHQNFIATTPPTQKKMKKKKTS